MKAVHPPAIEGIGGHVKHQSKGWDAGFCRKEEEEVSCYCRIAVQGMKANAAAIRVEDGRSEEMIQIHENSEAHYQCCLFPMFSKEKPGYEDRNNEMAAKVNELLQGVGFDCVKLNIKKTPTQAGVFSGINAFQISEKLRHDPPQSGRVRHDHHALLPFPLLQAAQHLQ